MRAEQRHWTTKEGWIPPRGNSVNRNAQLVLIFGSVDAVRGSGSLELARALYPNAHIAGCTTGGEIQSASVYQDSVVMSALAFHHTRVEVASVQIHSRGESHSAGEDLGKALPAGGLKHILLFCDGLRVSATHLLQGMAAVIPSKVTLTGGCAGDQDRMQCTHLWCDSEPQSGVAFAIGFYGERLGVHIGATGAWGPFGPERLVTKAQDNVLYELDGQPALKLYKRYLGDHAARLPVSGLLFPLLLHAPGSSRTVLRALTAFDEQAQSISFFGDIAEGAYARFMRGTIERMLEDTSAAARSIQDRLAGRQAEFTLLVSCFGRRHVLRQRIEEELEAVAEVFGESPLAGFYSLGEFGSRAEGDSPELHNETMIITSFLEE